MLILSYCGLALLKVQGLDSNTKLVPQDHRRDVACQARITVGWVDTPTSWLNPVDVSVPEFKLHTVALGEYFCLVSLP